MSRYTEKTEAEIAWSEIRTTVQFIANMRTSQARARALNRILPPLQDEFEKALGRGELLELGPAHLSKIEAALAEELDAVA